MEIVKFELKVIQKDTKEDILTTYLKRGKN